MIFKKQISFNCFTDIDKQLNITAIPKTLVAFVDSYCHCHSHYQSVDKQLPKFQAIFRKVK